MVKIMTILFLLFLTSCTDAEVSVDKVAAERGKKIVSNCMACHTTSVKKHGIGPSLAGIFGRKAATKDAYQYSEALKASSLLWDESTLKSFLLDPQALVPGTNMVNNNLDSQSASDAVEFLKTL